MTTTCPAASLCLTAELHDLARIRRFVGETAGSFGFALVIRLRDEAVPFDSTRVLAPDMNALIEQRTPGGLGIYLISRSMDEVTYRRLPSGKNELTLVKRVP